MKTINQYRPYFVEPEHMSKLGYVLVSDEDGYLKYQNDGITVHDRSYNPNGPLPKGKRIVYFNCTYMVDGKMVFLGIMEDWDTRTCYNGVCIDDHFLETLLNAVK